jgi:transcription-repair coupling factor (superfamily II helicase)
MGFTPVPTVTEPGDYALRGGIVDIFPPGGSGPVRLDFFGDQLDGLRLFDPETQRTVAKLKAARIARRMADLAVQFHGGMGYVEENWPARFFRDTRLWSIGGGADEVMLRTLARMNGIVGD